MEEIKYNLEQEGWSFINLNIIDNELVDFAKQIGIILPDDNGNFIQTLKPKDAATSIKGSFSYNYGLSSFPLHTDTAYWSIPARFIIMASEFESNCSTYLLNFEDIKSRLTDNEFKILKRAIFTTKTFNQQKFSSLFFIENETIGIRYDNNIMIPFNGDSQKSLEIISKYLSDINLKEIKWTGKNAIIFDNWKFLHSRGDCTQDKKRIIKRIYLK